MQKLLEIQIAEKTVQLFYDYEKIVCIKHFGNPGESKVVKTSTIMLSYNDALEFNIVFRTMYENKQSRFYKHFKYIPDFVDLKIIDIKTNRPVGLDCYMFSPSLNYIEYLVVDKKFTEIKNKDWVNLRKFNYVTFISLTKAKIFMACLAELEM